MCKLGGRDHNATSYSTETGSLFVHFRFVLGRDHNATSYSTETAFQIQKLYERDAQRS